MNIEAYDADSLRKMIRVFEYENKILKDKLKKAGILYEEVNPFEEKIESAEEYDLDQGERIVNPPYITEKMAIRFFSMFWGREDVYARRGKNGGYFPQCANRWNDRLCPKQRKEKVFCDECENTKWISLDVKKIIAHLLGTKEDGSDVIGVYPLLPNGTCRFIVFDFDNHEKGAEVTDFANTDNEWHKEVEALRKMCELNGIRPLVERSRSGKGAHIWIFFKRAIPAETARNFGFLLLDKGSTSINRKSFHYYDRMYPSQDVASSIGNLIALPLQGQALKNGNSAFVDENWNAYPDQWEALFNKTRKLGIEDGEQCMAKWQGELAEARGMLANVDKNTRPKPWKKKYEFCNSDVVGRLHMVLGNGVYIDTLNLMPRIQNQIRSLAAFDNPEFYKNKRLGYSNYYNFSAVYLGKDIDGYIRIPRGLRENVIQECEKAGISVDVSDQRETGQPIRVSFKGDLRMQQIVYCSKCGDIYRRVVWNNRGKRSIVWSCCTRVEHGPGACNADAIHESELQNLVVRAINMALGQKDTMYDVLQRNVEAVLTGTDGISLDEIDARLEELQKELLNVANAKENYDSIVDEIYRLREAKQNAQVEGAEREGMKQRISEMQQFLAEQTQDITEYDEQLVCRLIEKITVYDEKVIVEFKSGTSVDIHR